MYKSNQTSYIGKNGGVMCSSVQLSSVPSLYGIYRFNRVMSFCLPTRTSPFFKKGMQLNICTNAGTYVNWINRTSGGWEGIKSGERAIQN